LIVKKIFVLQKSAKKLTYEFVFIVLEEIMLINAVGSMAHEGGFFSRKRMQLESLL